MLLQLYKRASHTSSSNMSSSSFDADEETGSSIGSSSIGPTKCQGSSRTSSTSSPPATPATTASASTCLSPGGRALLTPTHRGLSAVSKLYDVDGDGVLNEAEAALRSLDSSGRGYLTNDKVLGVMEAQLDLQRQMFNLKRLVAGLGAFAVLLALSNLGTAFAAARLAKDTAVRPPSSSSGDGDGGAGSSSSTGGSSSMVATLTDREGHDLATVNKGISIEATTTEGIPYIATTMTKSTGTSSTGQEDRDNDGGDGNAQRKLVEEYIGGGGDNLRGSDAVNVDADGTSNAESEANRLNGSGGTNGTAAVSNTPAADGPVITAPDGAAAAGLSFRTNLIGPDQAEEIFRACRFSTPTTITHFCLGQPTITRIGCTNAQKIGGWLTSDAGGDGEPAPYTYTFDHGVKILCGLFSDNSRASDAMGGCNILGLPCGFNRGVPKPACGDGRPSMNVTAGEVLPQNHCTASCECESDCCVGFTTPVCMEEAPNEFTSCVI